MISQAKKAGFHGNLRCSEIPIPKQHLAADISLSSKEMSLETKRDGAIAGNLFVARKFAK